MSSLNAGNAIRLTKGRAPQISRPDSSGVIFSSALLVPGFHPPRLSVTFPQAYCLHHSFSLFNLYIIITLCGNVNRVWHNFFCNPGQNTSISDKILNYGASILKICFLPILRMLPPAFKLISFISTTRSPFHLTPHPCFLLQRCYE